MCSRSRAQRVSRRHWWLAGASIAVHPTMTGPLGNERVSSTVSGQPVAVWRFSACTSASGQRSEVGIASAVPEVLRSARAHARARPRSCALVGRRRGATCIVFSDSATTQRCSAAACCGYVGEEMPRQAPGRLVVMAPRYACFIRASAFVPCAWLSRSTCVFCVPVVATPSRSEASSPRCGRDERQEDTTLRDGAALPARESLRRVCVGRSHPSAHVRSS